MALKITMPSQRTIDDHQAVLDAVKQGDPNKARRAMLHHLKALHNDMVRAGIEPDSNKKISQVLKVCLTTERVCHIH